jgi:hypothetical protein
MRVRILKSAEGIMDGVSLAHLVPDTIYELDPIVAHYLITTGHAEVPPHSEHRL